MSWSESIASEDCSLRSSIDVQVILYCKHFERGLKEDCNLRFSNYFPSICMDHRVRFSFILQTITNISPRETLFPYSSQFRQATYQMEILKFTCMIQVRYMCCTWVCIQFLLSEMSGYVRSQWSTFASDFIAITANSEKYALNLSPVSSRVALLLRSAEVKPLF